MSYKLFPHQIEDSDAMCASEHLPNWSGMGTGKTVTTLEAVSKRGYNRGVVVAPPVALPMWVAEIEGHLGATASILKTGASLPSKGTDFHVVSYGIAANPAMFQRLYKLGGDCLICDEAHYLKTASAKRTKAIFGPTTTGRRGLFEAFKETWQLTGTPIVGNPSDLWAQLRATHPDVLRSHEVVNYEQFLYKFCIVRMRKYHPRAAPKMVVVATRNEALLNSMIYDDIGALRRTLVEVAEQMPPISYRNIYVQPVLKAELNAAIREMGGIEQFVKAMDAGDEGVAKPRRLLGLATATETADYLAEQTAPVIAGYINTEVGDIVEREVRNAGKVVERIMGGTSSEKRVEIQKRFNAGEVDVLIGQMTAMATSLNLQAACNHVVIVQDDFSPSTIDQFVGRVNRIGQSKHVQVDFIYPDHDIATAIRTVRMRKEETNRKVLDVSPERGQ